MRRIFRVRDCQPNADRDLADELQAHLELVVEDLMAGGMSEEDARAKARRSLDRGSGAHAAAAPQARSNLRRRSLLDRFDIIIQDTRYALRRMGRSPGFTLVAVLSLAIGIGANTAIFTIADQLFLKTPPGIPNGARMVEIVRDVEERGLTGLSLPDLLDLRRDVDPLQGLAAVAPETLTLSQRESGYRVHGLLVSANYFDVLGVRPAMGRTFLPEEDEGRDEHPVIILSHHVWEARMGSDPHIVGSTLYVDRQPYTVVGVAPEGFRGHMAMARADVFVPLLQHSSLNGGRNWLSARHGSWLQVLGLLRPGSTIGEAGAAVSTVYRRLAEEYPESHARMTGTARPFRALPVRFQGSVGLFVGILTLFMGLILLIIGANVAGIFLANARSRSREVAIRLSVGGGRRRLLSHFLTESLLIFLLGGAAGWLLAVWGLESLSFLEIPSPIPIHLALAPDPRALAFTFLLTLSAGLLFGFLPSRQMVKVDLLSVLKGEGERRGSSEGRLWRGFVTAQVGGCLVLLVAASLLLRALQRAAEIDRGFLADGAYVTSLDLETEGLEVPDGTLFQQEVLDHFSQQPGVEGVALAIDLPLDRRELGMEVEPEGWEGADGQTAVYVDINSISPGYFTAIGIPILEGRDFHSRDGDNPERRAVVNRALANRFWPSQSAVGRRILWTNGPDYWLTVVGVVGDTHNQGLTDRPGPMLYRSLHQIPRLDTHLLVRTEMVGSQVTRLIHEGLRSLDSRLSLSPVVPLDRYTADGILPQRLGALITTALGLVALLLSGMGLFGLMANTVHRRIREMGIRMAMGADAGKVLALVLRGAVRLALPGLGAGVLLAVGVATLLRSFLLGVSPLDPAALVGVAVAISGVVVVGTLIPALRASRVDPMEALRSE